MNSVAEKQVALQRVAEGRITKEQAAIASAVGDGHKEYAITNVHVRPNGSGSWLEATDGHILAITYAHDLRSAKPLLLPTDLLGKLAKGQRQHMLTCDGQVWVNRANGRCADLQDLNFPRVETIVASTMTAEPTFSVALDAQVLAELQKALGGSSVRLDFTAHNKPVRVSVNHGGTADDGQFGLLMPCSLCSDKWKDHAARYLESVEHSAKAVSQ